MGAPRPAAERPGRPMIRLAMLGLAVALVAFAACSANGFEGSSPTSERSAGSACDLMKDYPASWAGLIGSSFGSGDPSMPFPTCLARVPGGLVVMSAGAVPDGQDRVAWLAEWRERPSFATWSWAGIEVIQLEVDQPAGPFRAEGDGDQWNVSAYCDGRVASVAWFASGPPPVESVRPLLEHLLQCPSTE